MTRALRMSLSVAVFWGVGGLFACGSGQGSAECRPVSWSGQCQLRSVNTVRRMERFPRAYVVMEAMYEPVAGSAPGAPPYIKKEHTADALHEYDLRAHLERHPVVACSAQSVAGAPCGTLSAETMLPAFQPATAQEPAGPKGCEAIDRGVAQSSTGRPLGEARYDEHSESAGPTVNEVVNAVAAAMQSDPSIQCVALSGQVSYGEDLGLAERRARAMKDMLVARGVDPSRLTVHGGSSPLYAGTAPHERVAQPEHRHVRATVILSAP